MTHDEKITYMKHACGICGYGFQTKDLDLMVSLYELLMQRKGETNLMDTVKVESEVKSRDDVRKRSALLDKVSEKV